MVNTCGLFQREKAHFHGNQQQNHKEHHNKTLNKLALAEPTATAQNILWGKRQEKYFKNIFKCIKSVKHRIFCCSV